MKGNHVLGFQTAWKHLGSQIHRNELNVNIKLCKGFVPKWWVLIYSKIHSWYGEFQEEEAHLLLFISLLNKGN